MEKFNLRLVRNNEDGPEREKEQETVFDDAEVLRKATDIREYINGLFGRVSKNAIAAGEKVANSYTKEELQSQIMNSNKSDWKSKPGLYIAMCDRYYSILKQQNG